MFMVSGFVWCQLCHLFHWNFSLFQVPGDNEKHWKPVLVVLTEKDLLIYESMPRMKEAWFSPLHTYPLLATRYLCFFIPAPPKAVGTAEPARNRYSLCTARYHTWNAVIWEADSSSMGRCAQLNSCLLLHCKFWPRLVARSTQEGLWPGSRGRSAEKAKSSRDFYLSVADLRAWQKPSSFQLLLQAEKSEIVTLT